MCPYVFLSVLEESAFEYTLAHKKKVRGNMIFVGELCKKKMVAGKVIFQCIEELLVQRGEHQFEALIELLNTTGHALNAYAKSRPRLNLQMEVIQNLSQDAGLSTRIRCLLQVGQMAILDKAI